MGSLFFKFVLYFSSIPQISCRSRALVREQEKKKITQNGKEKRFLSVWERERRETRHTTCSYFTRQLTPSAQLSRWANSSLISVTSYSQTTYNKRSNNPTVRRGKLVFLLTLVYSLASSAFAVVVVLGRTRGHTLFPFVMCIGPSFVTMPIKGTSSHSLYRRVEERRGKKKTLSSDRSRSAKHCEYTRWRRRALHH